MSILVKAYLPQLFYYYLTGIQQKEKDLVDETYDWHVLDLSSIFLLLYLALFILPVHFLTHSFFLQKKTFRSISVKHDTEITVLK